MLFRGKGPVEERNRQDTVPHGVHEKAPDTGNAARSQTLETVHEGHSVLRRGNQGRRIQRNARRNPNPTLPVVSGITYTSLEMEARHLSGPRRAYYQSRF